MTPLLACKDHFCSLTSLTTASLSWPSHELQPTLWPAQDIPSGFPRGLHTPCSCWIASGWPLLSSIPELLIKKHLTNAKLWNSWSCVLKNNLNHESTKQSLLSSLLCAAFHTSSSVQWLLQSFTASSVDDTNVLSWKLHLFSLDVFSESHNVILYAQVIFITAGLGSDRIN